MAARIQPSPKTLMFNKKNSFTLTLNAGVKGRKISSENETKIEFAAASEEERVLWI